MSDFILILSSLVLIFAVYLFFYNRSLKNEYERNAIVFPYQRSNLIFRENCHHHHHKEKVNEFNIDEESLIINNTILRENIPRQKKENIYYRCCDCNREFNLSQANEDVERYRYQQAMMW